MNCDETFNAGICYVTDAYKRVCKFNEELHANLEKYRSDNAKLRELCVDVWHLFTEHGAVHPCDLPVVDAVRDRMRELGVEVD